MNIISCQNVWKTFRRGSGQMLLRQQLLSWFGDNQENKFDALKNVTFGVKKGEGLAVIGKNGAGKSTLLGLVTGLAQPDQGTVTVTGRVAALLELGSGFHPDLTGRENVFMNASLLGFNKKQTTELFDQIVEFSGVGDFIDQPLRTYSSGMNVRLAFSIAVNVDPDILIIDEVLAVGDQGFQAKCFDRIRSFREQGKTFLCVSHNRAILAEICDRAIWLDSGEVVTEGPIHEVFDAYEGRTAAVAQ